MRLIVDSVAVFTFFGMEIEGNGELTYFALRIIHLGVITSHGFIVINCLASFSVYYHSFFFNLFVLCLSIVLHVFLYSNPSSGFNIAKIDEKVKVRKTTLDDLEEWFRTYTHPMMKLPKYFNAYNNYFKQEKKKSVKAMMNVRTVGDKILSIIGNKDKDLRPTLQKLNIKKKKKINVDNNSTPQSNLGFTPSSTETFSKPHFNNNVGKLNFEKAELGSSTLQKRKKQLPKLLINPTNMERTPGEEENVNYPPKGTGVQVPKKEAPIPPKSPSFEFSSSSSSNN